MYPAYHNLLISHYHETKCTHTVKYDYLLLYSLFILYRVFEKDESKIVIDSASLELIKGATIDYKEELIKSAFVVANNPQSESACGCGSSFAVKNFSSNPAID